MRKGEFLQELREALEGELPEMLIRDNLNYYDQYISQETASGRREEDVIEEIGSPRLIARTIVDSSEAAGEGGTYQSSASSESYQRPDSGMKSSFHQIDLSKWYWKLLAGIVVIVVVSLIFSVVGGVFSIALRLVMRFAGPLLVIWILYTLIKGMRR